VPSGRRFSVSRIDGYGFRKSYRPFLFFVGGLDMPKKDGSSSIKTIEQVRAATLADIQRITEKLSPKDTQINRSILANR